MNEELREALARALWEAVDGYVSGVRWESAGPWRVAKERRRADAVLALPEVAALLADAGRVRRVRRTCVPEGFDGVVASHLIRAALDGDQP